MSRPSWDETWLEVAVLIARRSLCSRARVGAVIVDPHNRVVATGYNGPPAGFMRLSSEPLGVGDTCEHWCERGRRPSEHVPNENYSDCPSLHAEANALMAADRSTWQGGTIYVTGCVCYTCGKLVANSGLKRVVYLDDSVDRAYRQPERVDEFLRSCGLVVDRQEKEST